MKDVKVSNQVNKHATYYFSYLVTAKLTLTNSMPEIITFDIYDIVTLNCNATGYPMPTIVWLHNSSVVSRTERVEILPNGSLVLRAISSDAGLYVCTASSNSDNMSINVTLKQRKVGE